MQNTYAENIRQNNLQREMNERARTEKEPSMMEPNIGRIENQPVSEYRAPWESGYDSAVHKPMMNPGMLPINMMPSWRS